MENITIPKSKLLNAHSTGNDVLRKQLEDLFGKDFFNQKITDRVKTFEDACYIVGESYQDFLLDTTNLSKDEIAYKKLKIITRALNEGWTPDWNNGNERKWFPWFRMAGFGFGDTGCDFTRSATGVGSRLCFKSEELAEYAGKQFELIYKDLLV
jgi:hypothetical protein